MQRLGNVFAPQLIDLWNRPSLASRLLDHVRDPEPPKPFTVADVESAVQKLRETNIPAFDGYYTFEPPHVRDPEPSK